MPMKKFLFKTFLIYRRHIGKKIVLFLDTNMHLQECTNRKKQAKIHEHTCPPIFPPWCHLSVSLAHGTLIHSHLVLRACTQHNIAAGFVIALRLKPYDSVLLKVSWNTCQLHPNPEQYIMVPDFTFLSTFSLCLYKANFTQPHSDLHRWLTEQKVTIGGMAFR